MRILSVKHGSVISSKSPSDGQRRSPINLQIRPGEETQEMPIAVAE